MGLVGLVLLLCCVNLANLILARAAAQQHEIGIRVALGAGVWRLVFHLLTESALLVAAGLGMGLAFAWWSSPLLANTVWTGLVPLDLDLRLDLRVLAFAAGTAAVTTLLCGLGPAWHAMRTNPAIALQQNPRTLGTAAPSLGKLLVSTQVALSLVVIVGAALFVRSLEKLRSVDPGFHRRGILMVQLFPQAGHEKIPNRTSYFRELAAKVSQLPGVEAASYSHMGPLLSYEYKVPVSAPSQPSGPASAVIDWLGPGFFHLVGMRLLEGREFDWHDDEQAPQVAIVSESLARQLFPQTNPIGRKIDVRVEPSNKNVEIVGVVNSASLWKLQSREPMAIYIPLMQWPEMNWAMLDLRIAGNPRTVAPVVTRAIESLGHHFPLRIQTLEEREDMLLSMDRMIAMLSSFFGGLALLLASLGLYGLMSYAATRRTSEMGIRRALGAQQADIVWMIVRGALVLVAIGISIGLPVALAATRLVASMLFGLKPIDPFSIGLATILLTAVAILAAYLPARRASRVDPMVALRFE
jgi:predicted permease